MSELLQAASADTEVAEADKKSVLFHLEEYKSLRAEIARWSQEIRYLERAGVIGPVILYSWLFANIANATKNPALFVLWLAPVVCAVFLWIRVVSIKRFGLVIAEYIKKIEATHRHPEVEGWEHFLATYRETKNTTWQRLVLTEDGFWLLLTVAYALVAAWRFIVV